MAEQALEKLDEQLNCAICLDTYTDPKLLQCFHVYCSKCLVKLVVRDRQGQLSLTCPTCRKVSPVPDNGVSGLQSAFHINRLLDLRDSFDRVNVTALAKERKGGKATGNSKEEGVILKCSEHTDKGLEIYCETCKKVTCVKCVLKGGKHHGHDSIALDVAFDKYQEEFISPLVPLEKKLTTINSALAQLDARCEEISNQRAAIEDNIHSTFRRLHDILDIRMTELISELHQITQDKLKCLATQRDQIEITQTQLNSCLDFIRERGRCYQAKLLMMKNTIAKQVKELTATYCQADSLKPNTEANIIFTAASSDMIVLCQNYGEVESEVPDPSKCYTEKMKDVARAGEKTTALFLAVSSDNKPCESSIKSLECELVSEIRGTTVKGSVERMAENQYEISYKPTMKGRHQLHIKVQGHHIGGSPFTLAVTTPDDELVGTAIQTIQVEDPVGVTVHQNGEIIVSTKHCVSIFSQSGENLGSFGKHGSAQGELNSCSDVAVDGEGNILVADAGNSRIQKFTASGHFLTAVGTEGRGPPFKRLWGITVNASNNKVYVTDTSTNRIQVLNSDFTFSGTFGKPGSGRGEFNYPYGIACDSTGNVYVADFSNCRIQVFTAEGKFLGMFGRRGRGKLFHPIGVAVDTSDRVYVSEWKKHCVSVFTPEGEYLTSFGKQGKEPGEFSCPHGLAVDSSGVLYVCDRGNNRVQMF